MSFAPPAQMKTGGVDGRNLATTQEGIPLPWFCGIRRLKANWITPATARRTRDGGRRKGEHWYCNITAAFGYGPADGIIAMFYNGKYRDYGFEGAIDVNREDHPSYYISQPNEYGLNGENHWEGSIGRLHWGLSTAGSYPLLFGNDTLNPRYYRVILKEWRQLFLGINQPSRMPNIEAIFARSAQIPAGWIMESGCQYWVDGVTGAKKWSHGVPPVPALLEILTDKHTGFGRDPDSLDQSTWEGTAGELTADKWRINPLLDQATTEDAVIETFLQYFDGYTYYRNGKLALGRRPDAVTIVNPANYTEFTSHDMTRPPAMKTTRPEDTINELQITYIDTSDLQYKEVSKTYDAPTNREARGEPQREELDMSWKLVEEDVDSGARKYLGHKAAIRQLGKIWVRENRCVNPDDSPVEVGDVVFLDQSVPQLDHAYRVTGKRLAEFGEVELELETEHGQYPLAYVAPSDPNPNAELPAVAGISVIKWLELPYEITGVGDSITVFPIMQRENGEVAGCTVWFKDANNAYHPVGDYGPLAFGSSGTRVGPDVQSVGDPDVWTLRAALDDAEQIIETLTLGEAEDNTLLMAQGLEIYSVEQVAWDQLAGNYVLTVRRGRLGSTQEDHGSSGSLAFVKRSAIQYLGHEFLKYGSTITYKLQPRNWAQAKKLEDVTEESFTLSAADKWRPSIEVLAPAFDEVSGNMTGFQYIGDDIEFDWNATSPRGDLAHVSLVGYRVGDAQANDPKQDVVKVWDRPWEITNFKSVIEIPILKWYAMTIYASNRYGTTSRIIWAYANATPLPAGLDIVPTYWGYDIVWTATNLPDKMVVVQHEVGSELEGTSFVIEGDVLAGLQKHVRVEKQVTYNVAIWAVRTVNGKEWKSDPYVENVAILPYTAIPANGVNPIWSAPNDLEGILYWDGAALAAMVGTDGFLSYQLYHADDGAESSVYNAFPAGNGQANIAVPKPGTWWINIWAEDKYKNKGPGTWYSVGISGTVAGDLPSVPQVTGFNAVARTAATEGDRFYATYTRDGQDTKEVIKITYYPSADKGKAQVYETTMGTSGTNSVDLPVKSSDFANGTIFTFDAQRGRVANGITFYSQKTTKTATLAHYSAAPSAPTVVSSAYESNARRVRLLFQESTADDLKHTIFEFREDGSAWEVFTQVPAGGTKLVHGDRTMYAFHEDVYPGANGLSRTLEYRAKSVDFKGNSSTYVTFSNVGVSPLAFSLGSLVITTPGTRAVRFNWANDGSKDSLAFQVLNSGNWEQQKLVYAEMQDGDQPTGLKGILIEELPWKGVTDIRIWRGYNINGRTIWSAVYNPPDVTVSELTKPTLTITTDGPFGYKITWSTAGYDPLDWMALQVWPASGSAQDINTSLSDVKWIRADAGEYRATETGWTGWVGVIGWHVQDLNGKQFKSPQSDAQYVQLTTTVSAPTGFSYSFSAQGASLSWTPPTDAGFTGVVIQRKQGVGGTYEDIGATRSDGSYPDYTLPPNKDAVSATDDFYYRIKAMNAAGNSSAWVTNDANKGKRTQPSAASLIDATEVNLTLSAGVKGDAEWLKYSAAIGVYFEIFNGTELVANGEKLKAGNSFDGYYLRGQQSGSYTLKVYGIDKYGNYSPAVTDTASI